MKTILYFVLSVIFIQYAWADTIILKSGQRVENVEVVDGSADYIEVMVNGVKIKYWMDEVERIDVSNTGNNSSDNKFTKKSMEISSETDSIETLDPKAEAPQQVYLNMVKVLPDMQTSDELKTFLSEEKFDEIKNAASGPEEAARHLRMLKSMLPQDVSVVSEEIDGNIAKVAAEGTTMFGSSKGYIKLIIENGRWVVDNENWMAEGK